MVKTLNISILCLVETKLRHEHMDRIVSGLVPGWEVLHNYEAYCYGRIWICWDPGIVYIQLMDVHEEVLTCTVCPTSRQASWILSAIYGANQGLDRKRMLNQLELVKGFVGSFPWMLAGDFKFIRRQQDRRGHGLLNCYEKDFVECIRKIEVDDLPFTGCFYTWTNNQDGDCFVAKKLDRVMANLSWMQRFVNTTVDFLAARISDHSSAVISIEQFISFGPKPFKFLNFWAEHKLFLDWITEGWRCTTEGYSMFKLYTKLKMVKRILKEKSKVVFRGLGQRVI